MLFVAIAAPNRGVDDFAGTRISLPLYYMVCLVAFGSMMALGLMPFAALGVFAGHLLTADTIGPATGGLVSLLALVSGTWFPLGDGVIGDLAQGLPSYWLVQASHVSLGDGGWSAAGWGVVAAWSVLLSALAIAVHRRDTERV